MFVAREQGRPLAAASPGLIAVSIVTVGELRLGVLTAGDALTRARRLRALLRAEALNPLPVDRAVAEAWAELRQALRAADRRMPVNDSWIAATAIARDLPVVTQDADYDGVPGLAVVRV